jgi:hypothetical protein
MVKASNAKATGRLAGLAYVAVVLACGAGYLATTRLLTGDPRSPFGCAAYTEFGTCAWLLITAPAPSMIRGPR